jgi:hypothetical protein
LWRGLHVERLFHSDRGWIAWAVFTLAPVVLAIRYRGRSAPAPVSTLGDRLGRARGRGPELVFLVVVLTFVLDAARLRATPLSAVALATACSLVLAVWPRRTAI